MVIFPFFLILGYLFYSYKTPLFIIHPQEKTIFNDLTLLSFDDKLLGGNSSIKILNKSSEGLRFKYILREFKDYSKSNIRFNLSNNSYLNLAQYDYVKVNIRASKGSRIPFCLSSYIPNFSNIENESSFIYASENMDVNNQNKDIIIPLNSLSTPDWWYTSNNKLESDFDKPDLNKVKYLYISNCINLKKNIEDEIVINEISFHVDYLNLTIHSIVFLIIYFSLYWGLLYKIKKSTYQNVQEIYFQYKKIESTNHYDKEEETVLEFMKMNYNKADLTVIEIQNSIGIHERKISGIIKNKTGLTFKQYLNILRIEEAKHLLKTTLLQISEIGFKVGYGNPSHFNRVFKEITNSSPNDFRNNSL